MNYSEFLATKRERVDACGFDVDECEISAALFPWQRRVVQWAVKRGRAALFEDCGLGKTAQQLEWARLVHARTGRSVLIIAPLAVSDQTVREGAKFGIAVKIAKDGGAVTDPGVYVTNYERLGKFKPGPFAGIVLDESSILKAYGGKTRREITAFAKSIPFRLCCTATPAPNDITELVNHAEFLDIMNGKEILALFFRLDGNSTHAWRLKGHARRAFWHWMAEWSVAIRKPSDIGYPDDGYTLPPLVMHEDVVVNDVHEGWLFAVEAKTLHERRQSRRDTLDKRIKMAADLANGNGEQWLVWCDLNDESDALAAAIGDAVEVRGSDSAEHKESALDGFARGEVRVLVSKPSIAGFGMNFQTCHNVIFVGLSDSYESYYQAIRRCWRFGQTRAVECHVICSDSDGAVVENIKRKESASAEMFEEVCAAMRGLGDIAAASRKEMEYNPQAEMTIPGWLAEVA